MWEHYLSGDSLSQVGVVRRQAFTVCFLVLRRLAVTFESRSSEPVVAHDKKLVTFVSSAATILHERKAFIKQSTPPSSFDQPIHIVSVPSVCSYVGIVSVGCCPDGGV